MRRGQKRRGHSSRIVKAAGSSESRTNLVVPAPVSSSFTSCSPSVSPPSPASRFQSNGLPPCLSSERSSPLPLVSCTRSWRASVEPRNQNMNRPVCSYSQASGPLLRCRYAPIVLLSCSSGCGICECSGMAGLEHFERGNVRFLTIVSRCGHPLRRQLFRQRSHEQYVNPLPPRSNSPVELLLNSGSCSLGVPLTSVVSL